MNQATIFSIGHSNHSIDKFLSLLESSDINMVVDVRSAPFSRMFPQFNQETLKKSLSEASIGYLFLGEQIGGRSNDPDDYQDGQVLYKALANKEAFKTGIERLKEGSAKYRIALMCSEKEPLDCHRTLLVSQALVISDIVVGHRGQVTFTAGWQCILSCNSGTNILDSFWWSCTFSILGNNCIGRVGSRCRIC